MVTDFLLISFFIHLSSGIFSSGEEEENWIVGLSVKLPDHRFMSLGCFRGDTHPSLQITKEQTERGHMDLGVSRCFRDVDEDFSHLVPDGRE